MSGYIMPMLFLAVVFAGFALLNRNRYRGCAGCTGHCDKTQCDKKS